MNIDLNPIATECVTYSEAKSLFQKQGYKSRVEFGFHYVFDDFVWYTKYKKAGTYVPVFKDYDKKNLQNSNGSTMNDINEMPTLTVIERNHSRYQLNERHEIIKVNFINHAQLAIDYLISFLNYVEPETIENLPENFYSAASLITLTSACNPNKKEIAWEVIIDNLEYKVSLCEEDFSCNDEFDLFLNELTAGHIFQKNGIFFEVKEDFNKNQYFKKSHLQIQKKEVVQ